MSLNGLSRVVRPPAKPTEAGPASRWREVETALGTSLPDDYRDLAMRYGSGAFVQGDGEQTWIFNPLAPDYLAFIGRQLDALRKSSRTRRHGVFPESPGLFPVGADDSPRTIFYVAAGEPRAWAILVQGPDGMAVDYDGPLTKFLAELFRGIDEMPPWPAGWFGRGATRFVPSRPTPSQTADEPKLNVYQLYVLNGNKADFWVTHPGYGSALFHVRMVGGREQGPLKGRPPNYNKVRVVADTWEDGQITEVGGNMAEFASFAGFRRVDPPAGASGRKSGKR